MLTIIPKQAGWGSDRSKPTHSLCIRFKMPTIKQLIRNTRQPIRNVTKSPALRGCPQRRGTCTRVYVRLVQILARTKNKEKKIQVSMSVPVNGIK